MPRFSDVDLFLAVVDSGSFRGAAARLEVTRSTVSRGVQRLEGHLGAPLFLRDTRTTRLTDAGTQYHRHAKRAARCLSQAERAVADTSQAIEGVLRVSSTMGIVAACLQEMFSVFLRQHPGTSLQLSVTNRLVNPLLENVDLAIRAGERLADSDLKSRRLLRSKMVLVGTPEVAAIIDRGDPVPAVVFDRPGGSPFMSPAPVPLNIRLRIDEYAGVAQAIRDGLGAGVVSEAFHRRELADGSLVRVLPDWPLGDVSYWAVYPSAGRVPARLRALLDHLTESMAALQGD